MTTSIYNTKDRSRCIDYLVTLLTVLQVTIALLLPEGDGVDDGRRHQGQGRRADGSHQRDEQVQAGNGGSKGN